MLIFNQQGAVLLGKTRQQSSSDSSLNAVQGNDSILSEYSWQNELDQQVDEWQWIIIAWILRSPLTKHTGLVHKLLMVTGSSQNMLPPPQKKRNKKKNLRCPQHVHVKKKNRIPNGRERRSQYGIIWLRWTSCSSIFINTRQTTQQSVTHKMQWPRSLFTTASIWTEALKCVWL